MPKKNKKHSKKTTVKAKASANVHVEIHHHHSKKRGKFNSAPRMPQFLPMGNGSTTVVNNIPSQDYPNFQQMHQQASYENMIKNLAAEIQALKLSTPSANQEAVTNHAQAIKNEIDSTVKPTVKLTVPGTDSPKIETGGESTPQKTYNNDLFNDSPLDVDGFSPTLPKTPPFAESYATPSSLTQGTPSFSFSFPTPQSAKPPLSMDMTESTTYNPIKRELSSSMIQPEIYKPSALDIASIEYDRLNTYSGDVRNTMLKDAAGEYARAVKNKDMIQYVNKLNRQGRGGFYPKLETDFKTLLNNDLIAKYGPGNVINN